ncbi:PREDICTED: L-type lectin-domain containing receptor kinase IX.1-like [Ipomoea nil]|uniref:L-type lectin-domain containing receptor kinase IX.1-like n=1 Tax=Ipomoea nil TaxID=35883 RepID=UPI00090146C0|nr:PREDICTED: L-type lectin-domain containing receptor kinase IX.1-like [Ipomoea nil]
MNEFIPKSPDPFVAVVFDTYSHPHHRPMTNVSINIRSMLKPVNITPWFNNITQAVENNASITYNASSKILQVVFTGFWNDQYLTDSLRYEVDLRDWLPEFVSIGFSGATGGRFEKNNVRSWQFHSTSLKKKKNELEGQIVIGLSIGVPVLVAMLALTIYSRFKKTRGPEGQKHIILGRAMDSEFEKAGSGAKKFPYSELESATNSFAEGQKLGEGGFGGVYRGFLRSLNLDVAVKRVSSGSKQGIKEYASEVKIISRLRHRNLVPLHGWCHEKGELLLVYEFMPEGSLDSHLFKKTSPLNWGIRYGIAQGLASALLYLHEGWEKCVLHRDIKSSNVLLDSSFKARLGDFGLAKLVDHEMAPEKTLSGGTPGYIAPECHYTFKTSKESDVYSFGIVALEIACGQRAIIANESGVKRLVEWVWDLYGTGRLLEGADPKLCGSFEGQEMERLMIIGLWCAHPDNTNRPKMSQVVHCLKFQVQLPILPSKMPKPIYSTPPPDTFSSFGVEDGEKQHFGYHKILGFNTSLSRFITSSSPLLEIKNYFTTYSDPTFL